MGCQSETIRRRIVCQHIMHQLCRECNRSILGTLLILFLFRPCKQRRLYHLFGRLVVVLTVGTTQSHRVLSSMRRLLFMELLQANSMNSHCCATYRINWVELIYYPNMTGSGNTGPTISAVDPAGVVGPVTPVGDLNLAFSRLKSTSITMPY